MEELAGVSLRIIQALLPFQWLCRLPERQNGFGSVCFAGMALVHFVLQKWVWFTLFCTIGFGSLCFAEMGLVHFVLHNWVWFSSFCRNQHVSASLPFAETRFPPRGLIGR
jgi:hypothetical protein